eukprot:g22550.t1
MCSHRQPILMQCTCQQCASNYDEIDGLTGEQSGVCKQKKIPSPCARCETCECTYPDDTWLQPITRTCVFLGCEGGLDSSICTAILDDLPAPLSFDCQSGICFPDNITQEVISATRSINLFGQWTTAAICILFLLACVSVLIMASILVHCARTKRFRSSAPLDMPGAPLAALAAAQAALGGFGSATLVFSWQKVNCARNGKEVLKDVAGAVEARLLRMSLDFCGVRSDVFQTVGLSPQSSSSGRGALVALLGPSGSGKTTLLEALSGRMSHGDTATVCINGKAMSPARRYLGSNFDSAGGAGIFGRHASASTLSLAKGRPCLLGFEDVEFGGGG